MKKLDNIVVESLDKRHGDKLMTAFRELGINTVHKQGFCCKLDGDIDRYYGVINGEFSNFTIGDVRKSGAKIITLEQLKSMKEDKSEYPKLMWVGMSMSQLKQRNYKRVVFAKKQDMYISWANAESIEESENYTGTCVWNYAQDIEETPEPKKEVIDIAMNEDILKYAIIKINGKEVEYKK